MLAVNPFGPLQLCVYGAVPPEVVCAMLPSVDVGQLTSNPLNELVVALMLNRPGWPTLKLELVVQPFPSDTYKVYTPDPKLLISVDVEVKPFGPDQVVM